MSLTPTLDALKALGRTFAVSTVRLRSDVWERALAELPYCDWARQQDYGRPIERLNIYRMRVVQRNP